MHLHTVAGYLFQPFVYCMLPFWYLKNYYDDDISANFGICNNLVSTTTLLWPPWVADADIIFLPFLLFSSPNLSGRRLDIYHTSLYEFRMQVWNVLQAARWKYRTQKISKNRHLGTIVQICRAVSSQVRHVSTIRKKLLNSNSLPPPHVLVIW